MLIDHDATRCTYPRIFSTSFLGTAIVIFPIVCTHICVVRVIGSLCIIVFHFFRICCVPIQSPLSPMCCSGQEAFARGTSAQWSLELACRTGGTGLRATLGLNGHGPSCRINNVTFVDPDLHNIVTNSSLPGFGVTFAYCGIRRIGTHGVVRLNRLAMSTGARRYESTRIRHEDVPVSHRCQRVLCSGFDLILIDIVAAFLLCGKKREMIAIRIGTGFTVHGSTWLHRNQQQNSKG